MAQEDSEVVSGAIEVLSSARHWADQHCCASSQALEDHREDSAGRLGRPPSEREEATDDHHSRTVALLPEWAEVHIHSHHHKARRPISHSRRPTTPDRLLRLG